MDDYLDTRIQTSEYRRDINADKKHYTLKTKSEECPRHSPSNMRMITCVPMPMQCAAWVRRIGNKKRLYASQ